MITMKQYSFSYLILWCFTLAAMSPEEKAAFKTRLKGAQTSAEMEQIVKAKLGAKQSINISLEPNEWQTSIGACGHDLAQSADPGVRLLQITLAVDEVFFEDMHPFLFGGAQLDTELAKFAKYAWANPNVVAQLTPIFKTHLAQELATEPVTGPANLISKYNHIRMRCGQLMGEDRLLGGKEWLSRRVFGYQGATLGLKISQIAVFIGCLAAAGGVLYYLWNMDTEKQGNEDGDADQENINDDGQDTLKGTMQ